MQPHWTFGISSKDDSIALVKLVSSVLADTDIVINLTLFIILGMGVLAKRIQVQV